MTLTKEIAIAFIIGLLALYFAPFAFGISCKNEDSILKRIFYLWLINSYTNILNSFALNNTFLVIMIIVQILTFICSVKITKTFSNKIAYNIILFISSVLFVIHITLTFGNYYVANNIIEEQNIRYFIINFPIVSNIVRNIQYDTFIFIKTLKFYFKYTHDFVQQMQFYFGLILGGIIFENIFSKIRAYIQYKK